MRNSSRELVCSTAIPKSRVGRFAFGEVVETRRDLAFSLISAYLIRDIVVSLDVLPTIVNYGLRLAIVLMIAIEVDQKVGCGANCGNENIFGSYFWGC